MCDIAAVRKGAETVRIFDVIKLGNVGKVKCVKNCNCFNEVLGKVNNIIGGKRLALIVARRYDI